MTAKKSTKIGKNFRVGVGEFSGWPEYIPLLSFSWSFLGRERVPLILTFFYKFPPQSHISKWPGPENYKSVRWMDIGRISTGRIYNFRAQVIGSQNKNVSRNRIKHIMKVPFCKRTVPLIPVWLLPWSLDILTCFYLIIGNNAAGAGKAEKQEDVDAK